MLLNSICYFQRFSNMSKLKKRALIVQLMRFHLTLLFSPWKFLCGESKYSMYAIIQLTLIIASISTYAYLKTYINQLEAANY